MPLDREHAAAWVRRWDLQQASQLAAREARFAAIVDVVVATAGRPDPVVVDLGCGPGSLAVRLLDRMPAATVLGVDADPLLLALAAATYGDRPGLTFADRDLRRPGWADGLLEAGSVDAAVSTTALHWLGAAELGALFGTLAGLLRPGGVLANGDHLRDPADDPDLVRLRDAVEAGAAGRAAPAEGWRQWWDAAAADPALGPLMAARAARGISHGDHHGPGYREQVDALSAAGFRAVGTVWRVGDDRVLVAVR